MSNICVDSTLFPHLILLNYAAYVINIKNRNTCRQTSLALHEKMFLWEHEKSVSCIRVGSPGFERSWTADVKMFFQIRC